jgi:hypothetical protein
MAPLPFRGTHPVSPMNGIMAAWKSPFNSPIKCSHAADLRRVPAGRWVQAWRESRAAAVRGALLSVQGYGAVLGCGDRGASDARCQLHRPTAIVQRANGAA